ncbi:MAG TPA: hypothetical protein VFE62_22725 [Gemmataceae bacterium]|nr:hypothetical protein [Gemmataceae bacterium]
MFSFGVGLGIMLHFVKPELSSLGQVGPKHGGHVELCRHREHRRRRRLSRHELLEFGGQFRLDVLPCLQPILRVLGAAANVWLVAAQE